MQHARQIGLVQRGGVIDPGGEMARRLVAEAGEELRCLVVHPAATGSEPDRCGEVVEGDDGFEAHGARALNHCLVVIEHGDRELARFRLDPRPFEAEAIGIEAKVPRELEIGAPQLEAVGRIARRLGEGRGLDVFQQPAIGIDVVAFDLVAGGGCTPDEIGREGAGRRGGLDRSGDRAGGGIHCQARSRGRHERASVDCHSIFSHLFHAGLGEIINQVKLS